ncbi:hypothetical protein CFBP7129_01830 [Agrobacterium tumefaciens]|uniref:Uncharacterized protein n=1 Tax=Agrobacterium tumefaciens TaxID=358 RepID=A0A4D7Y821_AGRTU|nr:hypothetical protein CFBP7129_01830 [Agrobacterium tumefaciens]
MTGNAPVRAFSLFFESRKHSNSLLCRISGRKTGLHFCWKCFRARNGRNAFSYRRRCGFRAV